MRYTRAEREDLARRKEQWILRVEQGEDPKRVGRELKLKLKPRALERLKRRYRAGGWQWQALLDHRPGRRRGATGKKYGAKKHKQTAHDRHRQTWARSWDACLFR